MSQFNLLENQRVQESLSQKLNKFSSSNVMKSEYFFLTESILLKMKNPNRYMFMGSIGLLTNWPKTYTNKPKSMDPKKP
jgi:hypothetical protein